MQPAALKEKNRTLGKPADMTDEQCSPLEVWLGLQNIPGDDKAPVVVSAWQPGPEDIERINRGEPVYLSIVGINMPPVNVFTGFNLEPGGVYEQFPEPIHERILGFKLEKEPT